ncbi:hypothetical protein AArcSl_0904 [Halalkaliarchaeum desulfuricum]|uniref:SnoaL-like domain-containing protein n=1 Tax=Halalkaliarchaeum desulfuricum TaxID=2055893 RepID=A0A343THH0_9EURY|nr:nuclear transport factor 2 family protein [Halalkaliarchaeum desulfuricum]AUX08542.1 hypothetical protein AArcSl_0904 [Halalkaliarchaeum desulfuricum]
MDADDDVTTVERSADGDGRDDADSEGTGRDAVESYYASIDAHEYDRLASLLAPSFVHYRPDRTLDGRETFVTFMREERPMTETTHEIESIYPNGHGVAARGRLLDAAGEELFSFVDVFWMDGDGRIDTLYTYTG